MSIDRFAGINAGDKVRVEFADGAAEGVLWTTARGTRYLDFGHSNYEELALREPILSVTVLRRALPPEPPIGSVVRCEGCGWVHVRDEQGWARIDKERRVTWRVVNGEDGGGECGPVIVLYKAPEHSERAEMQCGMTTPQDVSTYASGNGEQDA